MIIQKVIRGMGGINQTIANQVFDGGIICNWWRNNGAISRPEIASRLTETNLYWHQNRFDDPDPAFRGKPFKENTPFISTTAGCIERDLFTKTNVMHRAWFEAIRFASNFWTTEGYLFYCDLFVLSKRSVGYEQFAEELRELNTYHHYSPYHLEGEIVAKIVIPGVQIEKWEYYDFNTIQNIVTASSPSHVSATHTEYNSNYLNPERISNIRELI
jgi:hypothetical protein